MSFAALAASLADKADRLARAAVLRRRRAPRAEAGAPLDARLAWPLFTQGSSPWKPR